MKNRILLRYIAKIVHVNTVYKGKISSESKFCVGQETRNFNIQIIGVFDIVNAKLKF